MTKHMLESTQWYIRMMHREIESYGHERKPDTSWQGFDIASFSDDDDDTRWRVWRADSLAWGLEQIRDGRPIEALRGLLQAKEYHGRCRGVANAHVSDAMIQLRNALEDALRDWKRGGAIDAV